MITNPMTDQDIEILHLKFLLQIANQKLDVATQEINSLKDRLKIPGNTTCEKCQKTFETFVKLKAHEAKDIPCDFVCQICDKQCYNRHKYYRHMKEHT